ncbi:unnamed protein product [Enterobius vermicularis]|uniref:CHK domain-containing protein n=1 Tax=Enterobius vermicularis TaxID=51028 RepID=A0A0N4UZ73_ENTVE|nr:unnamed protein product [Enterobius vermicularis]
MMKIAEDDQGTTLDTPMILNSTVSVQFVEEKFMRMLNTTSRFGENVEVTTLGVGEGFLSIVARLRPNWIPQEENLPQSFIVKIPSVTACEKLIRGNNLMKAYDEENISLDSIITWLNSFIHEAHNAEVAFYKMVQECKIAISVPKMYFGESFTDASSQGLLAFEDVGDKAATIPIYQTLTIDEVKQVLSEIAVLHAYSMRNPNCFCLGNLSVAEVILHLAPTVGYVEQLKLFRRSNIETVAPICDELLDYYEDVWNPELMKTVHIDYGIPPVLVHGDLWVSNVLWIEEQNHRRMVSIIDWQFIHPGCGVEDVARFIGGAMSAKERRSSLEILLLFYYQELEKNFGQALPFLFGDLKEAFERIYAFSLFLYTTQIGTFTQMQVNKASPVQRKKYIENITEKAIGLVEDILHYAKKNREWRLKNRI